MYQLNTTQLASVTGGASSTDTFAPRNPMLTNMEVNPKPILNFKPSTGTNISSSMHDNVYWGSACNMYHAAITPKNGDRNGIGKIYSWGTWWDDTN